MSSHGFGPEDDDVAPNPVAVPVDQKIVDQKVVDQKVVDRDIVDQFDAFSVAPVDEGDQRRGDGDGGEDEVDVHAFPSVSNSEAFLVDWLDWYRKAAAKSAATRAKYGHRVLRYGPAARQSVHLLVPSDPTSRCVVFVHGGALAEGHPSLVEGLGCRFLSKHLYFASVGYRLGDSQMAATDVTAAMRFLHEWFTRHGHNDLAVVVGGHSAGAGLVATSWLAPATSSDSDPLPWDLRGLCLISGVYATPSSLVATTARTMDPGREPPRVLLAASPHEVNRKTHAPDLFDRSADAMGEALATADFDVTRLQLNGDHTTTASEIGRTGSPVGHWIESLLLT